MSESTRMRKQTGDRNAMCFSIVNKHDIWLNMTLKTDLLWKLLHFNQEMSYQWWKNDQNLLLQIKNVICSLVVVQVNAIGNLTPGVPVISLQVIIGWRDYLFDQAIN